MEQWGFPHGFGAAESTAGAAPAGHLPPGDSGHSPVSSSSPAFLRRFALSICFLVRARRGLLGWVRDDGLVEVPTTKYAWNGDVALAYQVIGDGPVDLIYYQGLESHVDLVKALGGGDAYSGVNDVGDEVGISSLQTQTWQTMTLPGFGQGSCCPSNVPAKMKVVVLSGTHAFFRVTLSGQVGCLPNGAVIGEAGCFVRVSVGGHLLAPDAVVFARAQDHGASVYFTDSHSAQFVSDPLPAGTYTLAVQWSTLEASFTSDQFMITVDRIKTA